MPTKPDSDSNGHTGQSMSRRKAQHLQICTDATQYNVEGGDSRLSRIRFVHHALPEINEADVSTAVDFLGYKLSMPFFISSMTGGSDAGYQANKDLAKLAQLEKVPVGMGSIRILFRKADVLPHFTLKKFAPDVPVFANLGAVQIRDMVHGQIVEMIKRLEVDGLAVHLNPAQELFQPEGDRDFRGILDAIKRFCDICPVPVVVKETGAGINPAEITRLIKAGVAFVNIAGSGGTNWSIVESYRAPAKIQGSGAGNAEEFRDWGNPTGLVLAALRRMEDAGKFGSPHTMKPLHQQTHTGLGLPAGESFSAARLATLKKKATHEQVRPASDGLMAGRILASGGIRTGMDFVAAIALGARLAGTALPLIRAVSEGGIDAGQAYLIRMRETLRRTMVLTECATVAQFRRVPCLMDANFTQEVIDFSRAFD